MEEDTDKEARNAAQGLLDVKSSRRISEPNTNPSLASQKPHLSGLAERQEAERIPAFRPVPPRLPMYVGSGRIITSGNTPPITKVDKESTTGFKSPDSRNLDKLSHPRTRKPEPQERVTLVVAKPKEDSRDAEVTKVAEDDRKASFDLPVPPSAFAVPGRRSIDAAGRVTRLPEADNDSGTDSDEEEPRQPQASRSQPPAKRARVDKPALHMDRTVSINTVLQQRRSESSAFTPVDTQEVGQKIWGPVISSAQSREPNLLPRNSSDRSTLDVHKQIAQHCSSETITGQHNQGLRFRQELPMSICCPDRLVGAEANRNIAHQGPRSSRGLIGTALSPREEICKPVDVTSSTPTDAQQETVDELPVKEDSETSLWQGQIKHRLKTDAGSSVAELFSIHALVPSKLLEQLPPTIFINVLVGRSNVKLGKHYVANCKLANPSERQLQKATTLANMKLVAICELQHCTVTLVPHMTADQNLQLVAFLIADE